MQDGEGKVSTSDDSKRARDEAIQQLLGRMVATLEIIDATLSYDQDRYTPLRASIQRRLYEVTDLFDWEDLDAERASKEERQRVYEEDSDEPTS